MKLTKCVGSFPLIITAIHALPDSVWSFNEVLMGAQNLSLGSGGFSFSKFITLDNLALAAQSFPGPPKNYVCTYFNGLTKSCFQTDFIGEFYQDETNRQDAGTSSYIITSGNIYEATVIGSDEIDIQWKTSFSIPLITGENPRAIQIDYFHRWMVILTSQNWLLYDISAVLTPRLVLSENLENSVQTTHDPFFGYFNETVCVVNRVNMACYSVRNGSITDRKVLGVGGRGVSVYNDGIVMFGQNFLYYVDIKSFSFFKTDANDPSAIQFFSQMRIDDMMILSNTNSYQLFKLVENPSKQFQYFSTVQCTAGSQKNALFADIYHVSACAPNRAMNLIFNFSELPGGYKNIYEKSEFYNYGKARNTLMITRDFQENPVVVLFNGSVVTIPTFITETFNPASVQVILTQTIMPHDFVIEILSGGKWMPLAENSVPLGQLRVRDLDLDHPLDRDRKQTADILFDNGRGSRRSVSIIIQRIFKTPDNCPENAECLGGTSFSCSPRFTLDSKTGKKCVPCSDGTFKSQAGNQNCLSCPNDATCVNGTLICNEGLTINSDGTACRKPKDDVPVISTDGYILLILFSVILFGGTLLAFVVYFAVKLVKVRKQKQAPSQITVTTNSNKTTLSESKTSLFYTPDSTSTKSESFYTAASSEQYSLTFASEITTKVEAAEIAPE